MEACQKGQFRGAWRLVGWEFNHLPAGLQGIHLSHRALYIDVPRPSDIQDKCGGGIMKAWSEPADENPLQLKPLAR